MGIACTWQTHQDTSNVSKFLSFNFSRKAQTFHRFGFVGFTGSADNKTWKKQHIWDQVLKKQNSKKKGLGLIKI